MADRARYPSTNLASIGRDYIELKIKLNGASAPTILQGSSALDPTKPPTHTGGTNVSGFTLRNAYPEVIYAAAEPRDDSANGAYCTVGTIANEASGTVPPPGITFNVNTWNAGGTALNNPSLTVGIVLILRNSSTTYGNT